MKTTSSLRICHVAYTFYENDNRVIRYAEAFSEQGHQVDVVALRRPGQSRNGCVRGVRVCRLQQRSVNEKRAVTYLAKIVWFLIQTMVLLTFRSIRRRYDVVHVHNVPDFLVFAALVPKLLGARVILDIHDILPELYAGKFSSDEGSTVFRALLAVERASCRFADHVIIANHLWYDKLVRRTVAAEKCTTILNYPDLRLFKREGAPRDASADKFTFLYPGTLNYHQGVDVAIKAFALAADRMPGAEFHIYGEGPARSELVRLIDELRLADRVKLMARVPLDEIPRVMAAADAGVVPKRAEGFGNEAFSTKILEFMACGVPVVVSRTRIDAHYFDDTLVRFFASGQEGDLAAVLFDMYQNRANSCDLVRAAREFAVRNSWQERVADYRGLVESLLAPRHLTEASASL